MPKVVAEDLECPYESPGIRMELARGDVQLHHQLLLKEGEGQAQLQPFEDGGVYKGEGHPIGSPIVRADWHPSGRNAYTNVEIILPVDGAGGLIRVVGQKGFEVAFR